MSKNRKSINLTYVHHVSEFLIFLEKHKNYAFYVFIQLNDEKIHSLSGYHKNLESKLDLATSPHFLATVPL